ncbi:MAG: DUF3306 domain-containing protein [Proteobacteria bacterium]|nr:DUF3306 domain-containing protein [Pseudomonadota bacterium]
MAEDREGPLARWSRLKRRQESAAGRGGAAPVSVAPDRDPAPSSAPDGGPLAALPVEDQPTGNDAQPVEDAALDLPPIDSLGKDSDYTPFLADGVPEKLARAALRKMWRSDPVFGIRDGLDDYDEDFSLLYKIVDTVTAKAKSAAKAKKAKEAKKAQKAKPKETAARKEKKAKKTKKAEPAKAGGAKAGRRKKAAAGKSASPGAKA